MGADVQVSLLFFHHLLALSISDQKAASELGAAPSNVLKSPNKALSGIIFEHIQVCVLCTYFLSLLCKYICTL